MGCMHNSISPPDEGEHGSATDGQEESNLTEVGISMTTILDEQGFSCLLLTAFVVT